MECVRLGWCLAFLPLLLVILGDGMDTDLDSGPVEGTVFASLDSNFFFPCRGRRLLRKVFICLILVLVL